MNLLSLSSPELHDKTFQAAANEKRATLELLEYLAEVDRRRLYAEKAYSSLWEYVHQFLGYSEAQASERVSAMRLMRKVPEVKVALGEGKLTLTSTAKLASFVRRENASPAQTIDLLQKCENQSSRTVEKILVQNSTQSIPLPERVRAVSAEVTRITVEVDEEFMALVKRMKELKGNPGLEVKEVFKSAMSEYVKKREVKESSTSGARSEPKKGADRSRYVPVAVKNEIRQRSQDQCEFRSADSQRCESRSGLEFDHITPYAKGGATEAGNLRHLCKTHNLHQAIEVFGEKRMRQYLRT